MDQIKRQLQYPLKKNHNAFRKHFNAQILITE